MVRRYDVVFSGELLPGEDQRTVRERLIRIFQSREKIDALFAGGQVLVKRAVGQVDAQAYQDAFLRAGARCELIPVVETSKPQAMGHETLAYGSPPPAAAPVPVPGTAHDTFLFGSPAASSAPAAAPLLVPTPERTSHSPRPDYPIPDLDVTPGVPSRASGAIRLPPAVGSAPDLQEGDARASAADLSETKLSTDEIDIDDSVLLGRENFDEYVPRALSANEPLTDGLPIETLSVESTSTSLHYDLSLPRLRRNPQTGAITAEPAPAPERPGVEHSTPRHQSNLGSVPTTLDPPAFTSAQTLPTPTSHGPFANSPSPDLARALEASRFGMTVTAISYLVVASLTACGGFGGLVRLDPFAFLGSIVPLFIWSMAGLMLWRTVGKLPPVPTSADSSVIAVALRSQARFWRLWTIVNVAVGALAIAGFGGSLASGALQSLTPRSTDNSRQVAVHSWSKAATATGYQIELVCGDDSIRIVDCLSNPDSRSFECSCTVDDEATTEFTTRAEPAQAPELVSFANEGCGWELTHLGVDGIEGAF